MPLFTEVIKQPLFATTNRFQDIYLNHTVSHNWILRIFISHLHNDELPILLLHSSFDLLHLENPLATKFEGYIRCRQTN
ncbi:Uncharacterised protein [Mycobacterium tuberculosis]|nr:Uncharacterised protein [Mycobacterium tuberculosis]